MAPIGYSTGTLARHDFRVGLQRVGEVTCQAIELSALREDELNPLVNSLDDLDLAKFNSVSVHAPSQLHRLTEGQIVTLLQPVFDRKWYVVVHPDIIKDFDIWRPVQRWLCIENMDKRKPIGRTAEELALIFEKLPEASMCFDIAHAQQVDPTMVEAESILRAFNTRIEQIHVSTVNCQSQHKGMTYLAIQAYHRVASLLPQNKPIIIESPVEDGQFDRQIAQVREALMLT